MRQMRLGTVGLVVAAMCTLPLAAGCFNPTYPACHVRCGGGGSCPSGLTCNNDGYCVGSVSGSMCQPGGADGGPTWDSGGPKMDSSGPRPDSGLPRMDGGGTGDAGRPMGDALLPPPDAIVFGDAGSSCFCPPGERCDSLNNCCVLLGNGCTNGADPCCPGAICNGKGVCAACFGSSQTCDPTCDPTTSTCEGCCPGLSCVASPTGPGGLCEAIAPPPA